MRASCVSATLVGMLMTAAPACAALLNPLFQDHAVLQRGKPIAVWGTAAPGATVSVALSGQTVEAKADAAGRWRANLPAMPAGGPHTLSARTENETQTVSDVLVGDVYLCSGQSNMAMTVKETVDAGAEIQIAENNSIRMLTVANATAPAPLAALPESVKWIAASPVTVPNFSASCYYFARELQKSVRVPLGLINSSWGGANITTLMSEEAIRKAGGQDDRLDVLKHWAADPANGVARWGAYLEEWWRNKLGSAPWTDPSVSAGWPVAPAGLGAWSEWGVPSLANYPGHLWYRTEVTLTAAQAAQEAQLSLGAINAEDVTWVNGRLAGATFGYGASRTYTLAAGTLHEGRNDIILNVYCGWRGCGMYGPTEARQIRFKDGGAVPLAGPWRYLPQSGEAPHAPWGATAGLAMAYNAMIAPLAPYGLRGAAWYQGESNSGAAEAYRTLLPAMMANWRALFETPDLPFLIVQLPDYGLPPFVPVESDWARLRESQRAVVNADPNSALVVTIDIGDHMGLHPANKQEVGRRMSLAARRLIYGEKALNPGPAPVSARRIKGAIAVTFVGQQGKLAAVSSNQPIGFELCTATACRFATAAIRGNAVNLAVPRGLNPTHVRYCWADGPVCTLYDSARIPAVPFDIPVDSAPVSNARSRR